MKKIMSLLIFVFAFAVMAKYTASSEKIGRVNMFVIWGASPTPTTSIVDAEFSRNLINDDNTNDIVERSFSVRFDSLNTNKTVSVGGGPSLTYKQVTLYYLSMVADAKENP